MSNKTLVPMFICVHKIGAVDFKTLATTKEKSISLFINSPTNSQKENISIFEDAFKEWKVYELKIDKLA